MNAFRVGDALIDIAAPAHLREEIAGDLRERFHRTEVAQGINAARSSYWKDLASSLLPLVIFKTVTGFQSRWQASVAMGGGAAVALFLLLWIASWFHFGSMWIARGSLSAVVLVFILAFKRPQIGATVAFVLGIFVVEVIDFALRPSERHLLYGGAIYSAYLSTAAALFLVAFISLLVRGLFKHNHT